jgi:hypothetical protein
VPLYVRVKYNGEILPTAVCQTPKNGGCTITEFLEEQKKRLIINDDAELKYQCSKPVTDDDLGLESLSTSNY